MKIILLIAMLAFPRVLAGQQNCDALNLPTTALTDTQVKAKANAVWGKDSYIDYEWRGDRTYSIKTVGRYKTFPQFDAMFTKTPRPLRERDNDIKGVDDRGSWRRAWNKAMIAWCKAGGTVVP